jgi:hypothetical protein
MSTLARSNTDLWLKRFAAAMVLALVAALLALGIALYGPRAQAQTLNPAVRLAADGDRP